MSTIMLKWFRKPTDSKAALEMFALANRYEHGVEGYEVDYAEAIKWYTRSIELGNPEAWCNLGVMHQEGRGFPQSYSEAMKCDRKAADTGRTTGIYNIGTGRRGAS